MIASMKLSSKRDSFDLISTGNSQVCLPLVTQEANSYPSISLSGAGLILHNRAAALDMDKGFL